MQNKKIIIVSFSNKGAKLSKRIIELLPNYQIDNYTYYKYSEINQIQPFDSIKELVKNNFHNYDYWFFIGSLGIAVREIAPYIKHKTIDPAVITIDELAKFVISTLSGHIGGANEMTILLAEKLKSIPVITTATDINHKFSLDTYAAKNDMYISNLKTAKELSSQILEHDIGIKSDFDLIGNLPNGLTKDNKKEGLYFSYHNDEPFPLTLKLIPKVLNVGIGCKKGTNQEIIKNVLLKLFRDNNLNIHAIKRICSIDLKKEENGIIDLAKSLGVEYLTFTKEELMKQKGEYSYSEFVYQTTGVDCVCERSATIADNAKLIIKKYSLDKVTIAVALIDYKIIF